MTKYYLCRCHLANISVNTFHLCCWAKDDDCGNDEYNSWSEDTNSIVIKSIVIFYILLNADFSGQLYQAILIYFLPYRSHVILKYIVFLSAANDEKRWENRQYHANRKDMVTLESNSHKFIIVVT